MEDKPPPTFEEMIAAQAKFREAARRFWLSFFSLLILLGGFYLLWPLGGRYIAGIVLLLWSNNLSNNGKMI